MIINSIALSPTNVETSTTTAYYPPKVLKSLGLGRKIGRPVFQPHEPSAAGKILKVKELVKVENLVGPIPPEGFQRTRATKGYKVVGKMF
ncbi:hypothetical protein BKA57DRAFT_447933 [Linnemannia elongata]|nr:hypothetical protein BKA57DRAFT_447933 [Linnemannia elongata]